MVFNIMRKAMNCKNVKKRLSAYVDGELSDATKRELATHIENCPSCRGEIARFEQLYAWLEDPVRIPYPYLLTRVRARLREVGVVFPAGRRLERLLIPITVFTGIWLGITLGTQLDESYRSVNLEVDDPVLETVLVTEIQEGSLTARYETMYTIEGDENYE